MEEKIIKKIELKNDQVVNIVDMSRKISEDAFIVKMAAYMDIQVDKNLFSESDLTKYNFDDILNKIGSHARFEHLVERNFIMSEDRDTVFDSLVDYFCKNILGYLSKPEFPGKLIIKKYRDT